MPASHFDPLGLPVQTAQMPETPHAALWFPVTQAPAEQQKPPAHVPSPPAPHAAVHAPEAHVGVPPAHDPQARPLAPHAPFWVPATQLPALQHPPLHACVPSHALEQRCVAVLQDSRAGQSDAALQPQEEPLSQR